MVDDRNRERALETARLLVGSQLDPETDLRRQVVKAIRGSSPLACVNLVEILVIALASTFESREEFSKYMIDALAKRYDDGHP